MHTFVSLFCHERRLFCIRLRRPSFFSELYSRPYCLSSSTIYKPISHYLWIALCSLADHRTITQCREVWLIPLIYPWGPREFCAVSWPTGFKIQASWALFQFRLETISVWSRALWTAQSSPLVAPWMLSQMHHSLWARYNPERFSSAVDLSMLARRPKGARHIWC